MWTDLLRMWLPVAADALDKQKPLLPDASWYQTGLHVLEAFRLTSYINSIRCSAFE